MCSLKNCKGGGWGGSIFLKSKSNVTVSDPWRKNVTCALSALWTPGQTGHQEPQEAPRWVSGLVWEQENTVGAVGLAFNMINNVSSFLLAG